MWFHMAQLGIRYGRSFPTMYGRHMIRWRPAISASERKDVGYSPEDWLYNHWSCLSVRFTSLWGYGSSAPPPRARQGQLRVEHDGQLLSRRMAMAPGSKW